MTISYSEYASSTKVPKLNGLVVGNDGVTGILEEVVSIKHTFDSAAPDSKRRKK